MSFPSQDKRLINNYNKKYSKSLKLIPEAEEVIAEIQYWFPSVHTWKSKKNNNPDLNMACVIDDELYNGLRFEGQVFLMTPDSWKSILKYGAIDFLLMDSFWSTATGHWFMGQTKRSNEQAELLQIINFARKCSIPTIYWFTKGHEHHEYFKDFAKHFDYVFCADYKEAALLRNENIDAKMLPPCVQPGLYNPLRRFDDDEACHMAVIFDGWADLNQWPDEFDILREIKRFGLSVIESRPQYFGSQDGVDPDYTECFKGCVTTSSLASALKCAKIYITFDQTLTTCTNQQWMILKSAASGLLTIHYGNLQKKTICKEICREYSNAEDLLFDLIKFSKNNKELDDIVIQVWRKVVKNHTFSQRIQTILNTIHRPSDLIKFPTVTAIAIHNKPESVLSVCKQFKNQKYLNKELICIYRNRSNITTFDMPNIKDQPNIKVFNIPDEINHADCLKFALQQARGQFWYEQSESYLDGHFIDDMVSINRLIAPGPEDVISPLTEKLRKHNLKFPYCYIYFNNELSYSSKKQLSLKGEDVAFNSLPSLIEPCKIKKHTNPILSIIIPVFNKANNITQCLISVIQNELENFEVVCVDDASKDDSKKFVEKFSNFDTRVRLITHRKNHGAGYARNTGIKNANGKYIFFLDADDTIDENNLSELLKIAEIQNSDIVRGKITGKKSGKFYTLAREHLLHKNLVNNIRWKDEEALWFYWYFSANIYRRNFITKNSIAFPTGIRNEDPFFLCRCFLASDKISLYPDIVYYYHIGQEQMKKTPSLSFLTGWSMGNYYLYQLIRNQQIPTQYFLVHFPSLLLHSSNAVMNLKKDDALFVLKYIKCMFSNAKIGYYKEPDKQPWERKRHFGDNYINYIEKLKDNSILEIYDFLLKSQMS